MNKAGLIEAMASESDLPKATVAKCLDAFVSVVTNTLKDEEQVTLVGFGTYLNRKREARQGRNPRTGEAIQIAAANVPSFKAGKALKDAVN